MCLLGVLFNIHLFLFKLSSQKSPHGGTNESSRSRGDWAFRFCAPFSNVLYSCSSSRLAFFYLFICTQYFFFSGLPSPPLFYISNDNMLGPGRLGREGPWEREREGGLALFSCSNPPVPFPVPDSSPVGIFTPPAPSPGRPWRCPPCGGSRTPTVRRRRVRR